MMNYRVNGDKGLTVGDIQKAIALCMLDSDVVLVNADMVEFCVLPSGNLQCVFLWGNPDLPGKVVGREIPKSSMMKDQKTNQVKGR